MSKVFMILKEFRSIRRNNLLLKAGILLVLLMLLTTGVYLTSYSDDVNKGLADNLIRLHVIANSDSAEDQALKRDVRDVILSYMRSRLKESKDIEQTKFIINSELGKIEKLASEEVKRQGKGYTVKSMLGSYPFPTKSYGDVVLPAGNYQALRVVIGKGQGANWWCVLFPPLCFVDATHGTIPDSVKQDLRNALTEEEYSIVTSAGSDEDIPIKIKFKVVEFFQDSKMRFNGVISKLFR